MLTKSFASGNILYQIDYQQNKPLLSATIGMAYCMFSLEL